ncbi:hypothetical protein [Haematobacter genomosp. 1]|uniref:Bacteriophage tail tape measure N-terminal domain-containing protein n=1 Tax=Haematobacter genomosp. 1 TaxID=366618 RepID=A0A212AC29_9RHOB|nr:hypothetical protein [Haematobacter genomosp. 1]OWJ78423.1 hypothetical protein CDV49_08280 [Haematobacter genomosp. 1]
MADESVLSFRLEANIAAMEKALARAEARATKAANSIDKQFVAANKNVTQAVAKSGQEMSRFGNITANQRFQIQNTAAQFADLAVQIGSGTSVLTALGQQIPQILGPLGTVGALAGVAAAVFFPLANAMGLFGEESVDVAKQLKEVNTAISDLRSITAQYADGDLEKLREKYGQVTDQLWAMVEAQRTLARIDARQALDTAIGGITEVSQPGMIDSLRGYAASEAGQLRFLRDELSLTDEQARQLYDALNALGTAAGPQEQLTAFEQLRALAADMLLSQENLSAEQLTLLKNIVAGEDATRQLVAATAEIAPGITTAADEANRLASNLLEAMSLRNRLAQQNPGGGRGEINQWNYREPDPNVFTMDDVSSWEREQAEARRKAESEARKAARKAQTESERDAKRAAKEMARDAEQVFNSTRTAAEQYALEMDKLNVLLKAGAISQDTYNRAAQSLGDEFTQAGQFASAVSDELRSSFSGLFDGIVSGSQNAGEAISDLARRLAAMAAQEATFRLLGSLMPNVFGSSGFVPLVRAAGGGYISGPGSATSDSVPAMLSDGEFVVRASATRQNRALLEAINRGGVKGFARGGYVGPSSMSSPTRQGGGDIQIVNQTTGRVDQVDQETSRSASGRETTKLVMKEVNRGISSGMADKSMRQRQGLRPTVTRRG